MSQTPPRVRIVQGENLSTLQTLPDTSVHLVYVDPPFNTGAKQKLTRTRAVLSDDGHAGFSGKKYKRVATGNMAYNDSFGDGYLPFLQARVVELMRVLTANGSLFVHVDQRESHYVKVMLDGVLGRASFMNEIIWSYDYGGRSKQRWPQKHDTIFWYVKDPKDYTFNFDAIDRIPYLAPNLVTPEKAERGKVPTDVWWQTIVPTNSRERTGYPTQKPLAILERIVRVHSNPGDTVLDCFAGSGTTGEAALKHGRNAVLIDNNPEAIQVMCARLDTKPERIGTGKAGRGKQLALW